MRQLSRVTMSMRELDRLKCVQAVIDGELRTGVAAARLAMSPRQIRRLAQRYRSEGPAGLVSRQLGPSGRCRRPGKTRWPTKSPPSRVRCVGGGLGHFPCSTR